MYPIEQLYIELGLRPLSVLEIFLLYLMAVRFHEMFSKPPKEMFRGIIGWESANATSLRL